MPLQLTSLGVDGARDGGAITVLDGERAALLRAGRRLGRGVLALALAGRARAGRAGDPQVRRASVEVDEERLGGRADGDRASPLLIVVLVGQGLGAGGALGDRGGDLTELLDRPALGKAASVGNEVAQVLLVLAAKRGQQLPLTATGVNLLVNTDVLENGLLVVEGAVGPLEGAALTHGDADARGLDDGGRGSEEGKSHRDEGRFAEHRGESGGAGRAEPVGGRRAGEPDDESSSVGHCLNTRTVRCDAHVRMAAPCCREAARCTAWLHIQVD